MSKREVTPGWASISGATKWHYIQANGYATCGRWLYLGPPDGTEQGNDDSPDNCNGCRKRLVYRRSKV